MSADITEEQIEKIRKSGLRAIAGVYVEDLLDALLSARSQLAAKEKEVDYVRGIMQGQETECSAREEQDRVYRFQIAGKDAEIQRLREELSRRPAAGQGVEVPERAAWLTIEEMAEAIYSVDPAIILTDVSKGVSRILAEAIAEASKAPASPPLPSLRRGRWSRPSRPSPPTTAATAFSLPSAPGRLPVPVGRPERCSSAAIPLHSPPPTWWSWRSCARSPRSGFLRSAFLPRTSRGRFSLASTPSAPPHRTPGREGRGRMQNPLAVLAMAEALGSGMAESWDEHQRHMERLSRRRIERERIQVIADDAEYIEIRAKRSKLSANERRAIVHRVESRRAQPTNNETRR